MLFPKARVHVTYPHKTKNIYSIIQIIIVFFRVLSAKVVSENILTSNKLVGIMGTLVLLVEPVTCNTHTQTHTHTTHMQIAYMQLPSTTVKKM
jgi:hypothetical protein